MTPPTEKIQAPSLKSKLAKYGIPITILLVILLFVASQFSPSRSSKASIPGDVKVEPSLTLTAKATATVPATATRTSQPTATSTATATSTSLPTASQTPTPSATPPTLVNVFGELVNLRKGPGTTFEVVRKLSSGEPLVLLGRVSDNTWIYVKTSDGLMGWIRPTGVDLTGVTLDDYSIATPSPLLETIVTVYGGQVNLRTGPDIGFSKIVSVAYGEPLSLLGRLSDKTWLYVKTSDGVEGWIQTNMVNLGGVNLDADYQPVKTSPPTETATPVILPGIEGRWIDIDLGEQKLRAWEGTQLVATFLVSTGVMQYPTETGQFHIDAKLRYSVMSGSDYYLPDVPWTMYYYGDYSIHGTYWHHNFGTPMSHGCVNMDTSDAEWLYNWASVGTLVNIHY